MRFPPSGSTSNLFQPRRVALLPSTNLSNSGARPVSGDPFVEARVGECVVTGSDVVVADDDGVVFVAADRWAEVAAIAARIVTDEARQADLIAAGTSLRRQLDFAGYLARRADDPAYTLRAHLLERGGAIET